MGRVDVEALEEEWGMEFGAWLHEKYVLEDLSMREIGDRLDCSATTVKRYLDKYDVEEPCEKAPGEKKEPVKKEASGEESETGDMQSQGSEKNDPGYVLFTRLKRVTGDGTKQG